WRTRLQRQETGKDASSETLLRVNLCRADYISSPGACLLRNCQKGNGENWAVGSSMCYLPGSSASGGTGTSLRVTFSPSPTVTGSPIDSTGLRNSGSSQEKASTSSKANSLYDPGRTPLNRNVPWSPVVVERYICAEPCNSVAVGTSTTVAWRGFSSSVTVPEICAPLPASRM